MILKDTYPGVDPSFSYDKERRVTMVVFSCPNKYKVKLLHEAGIEEVTEFINGCQSYTLNLDAYLLLLGNHARAQNM